MDTPNTSPRRLRPAILAGALYLVACVVVFVVVIAASSDVVGANIGGGLIVIAPALPWLLFSFVIPDVLSGYWLIASFGINAAIVGRITFKITNRHEN
jgi:hypothetical protein